MLSNIEDELRNTFTIVERLYHNLFVQLPDQLTEEINAAIDDTLREATARAKETTMSDHWSDAFHGVTPFEEDYLRASLAASERERDELAERVKKLEGGLEMVREIIKDGAMVGFNCHEGDWAERLFSSQGTTRALLSAPTEGE